MERRDVLKAGALGVAAATVGPGCATVPHVDGGMPEAGGASDGPSGAEFVAAAHRGPRSPEAQRVVVDHDAAFRRMLRTLLITQGFRDLSVEAQLEPEVQARMANHMDEVDG